jgi:hypothetical protein
MPRHRSAVLSEPLCGQSRTLIYGEDCLYLADGYLYLAVGHLRRARKKPLAHRVRCDGTSSELGRTGTPLLVQTYKLC